MKRRNDKQVKKEEEGDRIEGSGIGIIREEEENNRMMWYM